MTMMDRVQRESVLNTWVISFNLNGARITFFLNIIMEIDSMLLSPACYCTTAMPVSLTSWLCQCV